jgi:hypothetical protein
MNLKTKDGKLIDFTPWEEQVRTNVKNGHGPREQTPIGEKADGTYYWWEDENVFFDLDTRSVRAILKQLS